VTGYVRPCKAHLGQEGWETYRAAYCGVCHALGRRYGQAYRCLLSYDLVFYALLIASEPFEERAGRCALHPAKARRMAIPPHPALDAAADATVLLACGKLRDSAADSGFWGRAASRLGLAAMDKAYGAASGRLSKAASAMETQLRRLAALEEANAPSLDRPADTFAKLLAALADDPENGPGDDERRVRRETLRHLGRWIYLIDAADDLSDDLRHGRYNPVAARFGLTKPDLDDEINGMIRHTMAQSRAAAVAAFDVGAARPYGEIVRNILTAGLYAAENRVFKRRDASSGDERAENKG
jgi:hypothetical protein